LDRIEPKIQSDPTKLLAKICVCVFSDSSENTLNCPLFSGHAAPRQGQQETSKQKGAAVARHPSVF
jgi:hypothetical protein